MPPRVAELIAQLQLQPHPEGGWFAEVHRATHQVQRADGEWRSALTTIYFLLPGGVVSHWHRVMAHEVWHWYEGAPLCLYVHTHDSAGSDRLLLGPLAKGAPDSAQPVHVVPQGAWQAAHSLGEYTLVGCTVGPGFDFADFVMLHELPPHERPQLPPLPAFAQAPGTTPDFPVS